MIAIVDYGMGNLRSVQKALEKVDQEAVVTADTGTISQADGVILPGVGAFAECMQNLERTGLIKTVTDSIESGRPFLGICLGYQLLFSYSEEDGVHPGLGVLEGKVVRLPSRLKVPHMGWNRIKKRQENKLFADVPDGSYFYFVHSYYPVPQDEKIITTVTEYGLDFASSVTYGNICGMQFHPEKSGPFGLNLLQNFGRWASDHSASS